MDSVLLIILIFLIIIIFAILLCVIGYKMFKKSKKAGITYTICTIIILFAILNISIKTTWFYEDHNKELEKYEKLVDGTWTKVYKLDNDKVIKQISAPGVSHNKFTHVTLPSLNRMCYKESCTIPVMMAHKFVTNIMWKSLKRIHSGDLKDVKYFPKIYEMDDKKKRYIQEYIPHELVKETCPLDFEKQMQELNDILKKKGYYLDDVHSQNWRISKDGTLKIIDCEVYTKTEKNIQQFLLNIMDGSQDGKAKGHKNASNILHWNDGRPSIENIC